MAADALAAQVGTLNLLVAAAIAAIAAPAASLYYGKDGKRALQTSFAIGAVGTIAWGLFVFSEAFAPSLPGGIIGNATFATINQDATLGAYAGVIFELAFALLTINLVAASVQHRVKPFWLVIISVLILAGAYAPFAQWMLAPNGWLGVGPNGYGAVDWAGGINVHVIAGVAALVLGVQTGVKPAPETTAPNFKYLATLALVLASFFLNAGRGIHFASNSSLALLNTQMAAFGGVASYTALQFVFPAGTWYKLFEGTPSVCGAAKGALIGLAATASGAGIILPMWTVLIAFIASLLVFVAERVTKKWLSAGMGVFLVHGFGGAIGAACTGLFAQGATTAPVVLRATATAFPNGAFFYNSALLNKQCAAISVAILLSGVVTYVVTRLVQEVARVTAQTSIFIEDEAAPAEAPKAESA